METFSASLAISAGNSPAPSEFPAQRPVTWSFDVFFDLRVWHDVYNTRMAETWLATAIYVWPAAVDTLPLVKT